jgi:uncharacterized repeat protein (TIGR03803 family)
MLGERIDTAVKAACILVLATTAVAACGQTFTALVTFDRTNGIAPVAVVQGFDGNFYGTTTGGGTNNEGTVFRVTSQGALTTLYSFCALPKCADGSLPQSGLVQASDGNLYGTTSYGGFNNAGTFFRITLAGKLTTLYSFCAKIYCVDGLHPWAPLIQGRDGNFYGSTEFGGSNDYGTIFKMSPHGAITILHSFCNGPNCPDGAVPNGQLVQAADGNVYGTTTSGGGSAFAGTIFEITLAGKLTTLYRFCTHSNCLDGSGPQGALVQAADGTLYGTTYGGGKLGVGTVFKFTGNSELTTLYSFCKGTNCLDGLSPLSGMIQATDGNLYGTTLFGGADNNPNSGGTIFRITPTGVLTTLYSFCIQQNCPDGLFPLGFFQGTDGKFYGAAEYGGAEGDGTVFRFATGLRPFVRTFPSFGKAGTKITIVGTNLVHATEVTFNGVKAAFVVDSGSEITATIPTGATTGPLVVTTSKARVFSNVAFQVVP